MKIKADATGVDIEITDGDKEFASKISRHNLFGMLGDQIASWRFKNAVRVFRKTEKFAQENDVEISLVPSKFLQQFVEAASLEEDENMQEMWAHLLMNKSRNEKSVNVLYVNILKSLEPQEAIFLEGVFRGSGGSEDVIFKTSQVSGAMNIDEGVLRVMIYKMYSFNVLRPPFFRGITMGESGNNPSVETTDNFRMSALGIDFCKKCGVTS